MCDIGTAIKRALGIGPSGASSAEFDQERDAALQSSQEATDALTKAIQNAQQASLPAADNPSALEAEQEQQRKVMAAQGAAWSFGNSPTVAPVVAEKVLFGK